MYSWLASNAPTPTASASQHWDYMMCTAMPGRGVSASSLERLGVRKHGKDEENVYHLARLGTEP